MTIILYKAKDEKELTDAYPINKMRNVGLDEVKTSHVLLIDADFIPSVGLDDGLKKAVKAVTGIGVNMEVAGSQNILGDKFALVVPAYQRELESSPCETLEDCLKLTAQNQEFMPRSMESLSECVQTDDPSRCIVFNRAFNVWGHGDTKSDEWLKKMDKENIRSIPCISRRYEPYVVIPWCPSEHANYGANTKGLIDVNTPLSPYYDER